MEGQNWRGLYQMATGTNPDYDYVEPYVASILFFTINMATGIVLRTMSQAILPESIRGLVCDFLATMEACAYFFENNFVLKHYGSFWFAVAIMVQLYITSRTFNGASENPVKALGGLLSGQVGVVRSAVQIIVQSLAGIASYRFAKMVWSLDLISDHHERYYEMTCASDLNVTFLMGFLIELSACLSDTWLGMQTVSSVSVLDEFIKYLNGTLMIVMGVATTGMYFNPAMASGHTFGCKGAEVWEHFFVYWAGPFVGFFVALQLDKMLHIDVTAPKTVAAEKKAQ